MTASDIDPFDAVWSSLDEVTKTAIRDKAHWEQLTLSAVIEQWWPKLWEQVEARQP